MQSLRSTSAWIYSMKGQSISNLSQTYLKPISNLSLTSLLSFFCQNGAKSGFEMCFGPSTLGAGAKTRLHTPNAVTYHEQPHYCRFMIGHSLGRMESRIKKFTPHCICRPSNYPHGPKPTNYSDNSKRTNFQPKRSPDKTKYCLKNLPHWHFWCAGACAAADQLQLPCTCIYICVLHNAELWQKLGGKSVTGSGSQTRQCTAMISCYALRAAGPASRSSQLDARPNGIHRGVCPATLRHIS